MTSASAFDDDVYDDDYPPRRSPIPKEKEDGELPDEPIGGWYSVL